MSFSTSGAYDRVDNLSTTEGPTGVTAGEGGTTLDIWTSSRVNKLKNLAQSSFTNQSSFPLPAGIVGNSYDYSWDTQEVPVGLNARAQMLDKSAKPLSGTAEIRVGGEVTKSKSVSGSFIVNGPPPVGAVAGVTVDTKLTEFRFSPSVPAVPVIKTDLGGSYGTIQYGSVDGTITDYDGEPVKNVAIGGGDFADLTDKSGQYELLAPGGTEVTLTTLGGTYEFSLTPAGGESLTQDISFPKLTIRVLDADYEPVENALVDIGDSTFETNEDGAATLSRALVTDYDVSVMDFFTDTVAVDTAGEEFVFTVGPDSNLSKDQSSSVGGVKLKAKDARSAGDITDIACRERQDGVLAKSNERGVAKLLATRVGDDIEVEIGTGDKRYTTTVIRGTLPDGEMLEETVELEPKTQTTNV